MSLGIESIPKRQRRRERRLAEGYPNAIARSRKYQAELADGSSGAEVARRFGVTRVEVCHYLAIIRRLPREVIAAVEREVDPSRLKVLSLRRLLRIARLPTAAAQEQAFRELERTLPPVARMAPRQA